MKPWLLALAAGCGAPVTARTSAPSPVAACTARLAPEGDTARLSVNGVDLGFAIKSDGIRAPEVATWPHGKSTVLLAWRAVQERNAEYGGSPDLYEIDCAAPKQKRVFASVAGANFGNAVMTADGKTLYFTGPDGARALDLATRAISVVTTAPKLAHGCDGEDADQHDVVIAFDEGADTLELRRTGKCDMTGTPLDTTYFVDHPATTKQLRVALPVTAVAIDAGGTWWAGAADALWSSADRGEHWQRSALAAESGPAEIVVDPKRPGQLAVRTIELDVIGAPAISGFIFSTRDGGKTWAELPLPTELYDGQTYTMNEPHSAHSTMQLSLAIGDSLDHLTLWGKPDPNDSKGLPTAWETRDVGKTWRALGASARRPAASVRAGTSELRTSPDGLLVVDGGKLRKIYVK